MDSLGSRIRSLRKQRKLTLEGLAGNQLTKGMLSLIENNKAKPSMESLAYIAAKLDIGVNELLESISTSELRNILEKVEDNFKAKEYQTIVNQLEKMMTEELPLAYESAKLLEVYGKACYFTKDNKWESILQQADEQYMSLNLYNQSAQLNHFFIWEKMNRQLYNDALQLLLQKREVLEIRHAELDILNELDMIWFEVGLLFSINKYDEASKRLQQAITLSKQKNVFYRIEEFYRIAYFYAMMYDRKEDMNFYLGKLKLFAEFTDSEDSKSNVMALEVHYYNTYAKQYDKALKLTEEIYSIGGEKLKYFYVMETGKALFGKRDYKQALEYLLQFEEITIWNHPFDLSIMYEVYAYIARCYHMLGQNEKALENAEYAIDHVDALPETPSKKFIKETMDLLVDC